MSLPQLYVLSFGLPRLRCSLGRIVFYSIFDALYLPPPFFYLPTSLIELGVFIGNCVHV